MAFAAKDGKKFSMGSRMRAHNQSLSAKAPAQKTDVLEAPSEDGGMSEEQAPEQIAEEHGPAHEVHMTHDHEGGTHHVHSVHPDGHEHHSEHGSAEEAHEHGKKLAGAGEHESEDGGESYSDEEDGY